MCIRDSPEIVQLPNTNTSDGSTVEHHSWNNGDGCVSVEHFQVINGGHDWPGTFGNMDIDASLEIWKYVSRYDLNGKIGCITSTEENFSNQIRISPNPVMDFITIEMDFVGEVEYQIFSTLGKIVSKGIISSDKTVINVCLLYTSPSPRDRTRSRMPSSA